MTADHVTPGSWVGGDPVARVRAALAEVAAGRPVVVIDDSRHGGELVFAAELADPQLVAFAVRHTSGFLSVTVTGGDADRLELPLMARDHEDRPAYCVSVDAREGVGTGISARDRARTVRLIAAADTGADDLVRPGHVVPLRVRPGGVLRHPGRAEAASDLTVLAGRRPSAVLGGIVDTTDPAHTTGDPEPTAFARRHDLRVVSVSDLIAFRLHHESVVERVTAAELPSTLGRFTAVGYRSLLDDLEHQALVHGEIGTGHDVPVHVHHECAAGDALGALLCGCTARLRSTLSAVAARGRGVVVYLRSGRPEARNGQVGPRRAEPDDRPGNRHVAEAILRDLGVRGAQRAVMEPIPCIS